jgi:hypothetical protein
MMIPASNNTRDPHLTANSTGQLPKNDRHAQEMFEILSLTIALVRTAVIYSVYHNIELFSNYYFVLRNPAPLPFLPGLLMNVRIHRYLDTGGNH